MASHIRLSTTLPFFWAGWLSSIPSAHYRKEEEKSQGEKGRGKELGGSRKRKNVNGRQEEEKAKERKEEEKKLGGGRKRKRVRGRKEEEKS